MLLVRDDAPEKLAKAQTLLTLAKATQSPEMLKQHLEGVERIIETVVSSIKVGG